MRQVKRTEPNSFLISKESQPGRVGIQMVRAAMLLVAAVSVVGASATAFSGLWLEACTFGGAALLFGWKSLHANPRPKESLSRQLSRRAQDDQQSPLDFKFEVQRARGS
jgi:uncharacterized protein (DUF58 family)